MEFERRRMVKKEKGGRYVAIYMWRTELTHRTDRRRAEVGNGKGILSKSGESLGLSHSICAAVADLETSSRT